MSAHTPGPWLVEDGDHGYLAGVSGAFSVIGGCGCCGSPWIDGKTDAEAQANALLIASAPELVDAVQWLLVCLNVAGQGDTEGARFGRAVLARATEPGAPYVALHAPAAEQSDDEIAERRRADYWMKR